MFKFFLLIFIIGIFHGANTEDDPGREEAQKDAPSSNSSAYSYANAAVENEKVTTLPPEHTELNTTEIYSPPNKPECGTTENEGTIKCHGPNESLKCVKSCPPLSTCKNRDKRFHCLINSTEPCKYECACDAGFYRNTDGYCVTSEECGITECTGSNEELKCVKSCPPARTCRNRGIAFDCLFDESEICKNECRCKKGFYRNDDGYCVTSELCDKKCTGPNEEYKPDKKKCPPELCSSIVSRYACDPKEQGQPGCVCKSGFLRRNLNSTCIPTQQCPELANAPGNQTPNCSLPNESLKCVKACPPARTCQNRNAFYKCSNNIDEICKNKCVCDDGFFRNADGYCVTSEQCVNDTCGVNEIWNECPSDSCEYCPASDAEARACMMPASSDVCPPARCTCQFNHRRAQNRTCVPTKECPPFACLQRHEQFDPCPSCLSDDCNRATPDGRCRVVGHIGIVLQCRPSCRCEKNYWRDGDRCVPYESCPNIQNTTKCTRSNEELKCVKSCPPASTCRNRGIAVRCRFNVTETCKNECRCKNGFYRNDDGFCVTSELCDKKCTDPNEEYKHDKKSCPPETCFSIGARFKCDSKEEATPGCVCKSGFLRKAFNSTCMPIEQCPEYHNSPDYNITKCTQPNEELQCVKKCPPARTCRNRGIAVRCLLNVTEICINECRCKDGFYRNDDGYCVTSELCDKKCTGPNKEYKPDKKKCPSELCSSIVSRNACVPEQEQGQPGCVCKSGFLRRNLNSTCIPAQQCPELADSGENQTRNCTLPHESLKCVKTCPPARTCHNVNTLYRCPDITNEICKNKCVCDVGFFRNADGYCVSSEQCENVTCGVNEIWNKCPSDSCEYCPASDAEARACMTASSDVCPPARCTCQFNHRRAHNGTCIPTRECPSFECSQRHEQFDACPSCLSDDCNRATPDGRCKVVGRIGIVLPCRPSCRCKKNYWRDEGRCVPYESCPNVQNITKCTRSNEELKCVKSCPPPRTGFGYLFDGSDNCKNECHCKNGFFRNDDGDCVTNELCDKECTVPNEKYIPGKNGCPLKICIRTLTFYDVFLKKNDGQDVAANSNP